MFKLYTKALCALISDKNKRKKVRDFLLGENDIVKNVVPVYLQQDFGKERYLNTAGCYNKNAFSEYRNIYNDRDVVVVGAGPTLNKYQPIQGAIHIGTNRVHQNKNLELDFLFRQDFKNYDEEIFDCNVKKFIGIYYDWKLDMCPQSVFNKLTNANKFVIDNYSDYIPVEIDTFPLWHGGSVIYSAMQFALWTNPKRIYLVGCDSAGQVDSLNWNHFDDKNQNGHNIVPITALVENWKKLADFAKLMYPDTEIISINPVGLKGLFKDIYQSEKENLERVEQ